VEIWSIVDNSGAPVSGATPAFISGAYVDRAASARPPPSIVEIGGGRYGFAPSGSDITVGIAYVVDNGIGHFPRYVSGAAFNPASPFSALLFVDGSGVPWSGAAPPSPVTQYTNLSGSPRTPPTLIALFGAALWGVIPSGADLAAGGVDFVQNAPTGAFPSSLSETLVPVATGGGTFVPPTVIPAVAGVLAVVPTTRAGVADVSTASTPADSGGLKWQNTGFEFLAVANQGVSAVTVTIDTPPLVDKILAITHRTVTVPAGECRLIGPLQPGIYNDTAGMARVTFSVTSSVYVKVHRVLTA
jgi:hypothetical protein